MMIVKIRWVVHVLTIFHHQAAVHQFVKSIRFGSCHQYILKRFSVINDYYYYSTMFL